jgi:hypothetical protein
VFTRSKQCVPGDESHHIRREAGGRASAVESEEMDGQDVAMMRKVERRRNSRFGSWEAVRPHAMTSCSPETMGGRREAKRRTTSDT